MASVDEALRRQFTLLVNRTMMVGALLLFGGLVTVALLGVVLGRLLDIVESLRAGGLPPLHIPEGLHLQEGAGLGWMFLIVLGLIATRIRGRIRLQEIRWIGIGFAGVVLADTVFYHDPSERFLLLFPGRLEFNIRMGDHDTARQILDSLQPPAPAQQDMGKGGYARIYVLAQLALREPDDAALARTGGTLLTLADECVYGYSERCADWRAPVIFAVDRRLHGDHPVSEIGLRYQKDNPGALSVLGRQLWVLIAVTVLLCAGEAALLRLFLGMNNRLSRLEADYPVLSGPQA